MTKRVMAPSSTNDSDYIIVDSPGLRCKEKNIDINNLPKVSFCIPTLNNEDTIEACLRSIADQDYPQIEIIIVDGHSKDKTIDIAQRFTHKIFFDSGKLGSARQTGFKNSTGEVIALFDSDIIIPHPEWLINAIKYFNCGKKVSTVWPVNVAPPTGSLTVRLYFNHWKLIIEDRISKRRGLYGGGNALFLRTALEEIGGIDKSLHWGEDFDWAQKLKERGYQVVYIHDPLYHDTMQTLKEFTSKQFTGAKTFTNTGFQFMNLTSKDIFFEQVVLGIKGMFIGLFKEKDVSWFLFPAFMVIRCSAYAYTYMAKSWRG